MSKYLAVKSGFTLIELLVSVVILAILGGAFISVQFLVSQNQTSVFRNYVSIEETNTIVSSLARELRNATGGENGSFSLVTLSDQEIIFYSDYDFDGRVERIRYTLTGTSLIKGIVEPTDPPVGYPLANERVQTLTGNVRNGQNPVFFYYNEDWPQDTINNPLQASDRLSDTQLIKIVLILNAKADDPIRDYKIESFTQVRMLKGND